MEVTAYRSALHRSLELCRELAADPVPAEEALAELRRDPQELDPEEARCLELVLESLAALQEVGAELPPLPPAAPALDYAPVSP